MLQEHMRKTFSTVIQKVIGQELQVSISLKRKK